VRFRITHHSGFAAPADALDLLSARVGASRDGISFAKVGHYVRAMTPEDAPVSVTRDERIEIGRRRVLDMVREVCESSTELKSDWFAVSPEP
jgi:hypothetical protein